ncbi:MAG: nuclear transport factor 2 family protein [Hyphomonadaceae bacterium]
MRHEAYHRAAAAKDVDGVIATFAEDLRFYSPTKKTPFEGKAIARWLFTQLFDVLEDFRFTETVANEETAVLFFACRIAGREAEGCDVLKFNEVGEISEFRVLIRPLPALAALNEAMGARLADAKIL